MNYLETNFLSVVIVARNENNMIESQLNMLFREIKKHFKNFEIIVVDNASNDGTSEILKNYSEKMTIIELPFCHSEGMALAAGVDIAIGDYIVEIPYIDGTLDISLIYKMYEKLIGGGTDFIFCVPKKTPWSSKIFYRLINKALGLQVGQCTSTVMTMSSRRGQNKVSSLGSKIVNRTVAYCMSGLDYDTAYSLSEYRNRRGFGNNIKLFVESLVYYTNYMSKWMMGLSMIFFVMTCAFGVYSVIAKFVTDTAYGWASMVLFTCLGFAGVFLLLAIISVYLEHILKSSINTKNYIFSDVKKNNGK